MSFLKAFGRYLLNILIAFDQFVTACLGGYPDETLSSYAWRMHLQKKPWGFTHVIINRIFFWEENHCKESYNTERLRTQLPPEFRD